MKRTLVPRIKISKGFTLIEVLLVIGLIALITAAAIPSLGVALKVNINTSSREIANLIRSAYDESVLTGKVHRLVFDLDTGQYWAEVGNRTFLMRTERQKEEDEKRLRQLSEEERATRKEPFTLSTTVNKRKKKLPSGVKFLDAITPVAKDPVSKGIVYAHIFPQGFVENITLHLKDDYERESTLIVNSVTGKSRVYQRYYKESE